MRLLNVIAPFFVVSVGWNSVAGAAAGGPTLAHHHIITEHPLAQAAFDQGLTLTYAFNFGAARAAFVRAAKLDPTAPMPYWGIALADGPNYNALRPSPSQERAASDALSKGLTLALAYLVAPKPRRRRATSRLCNCGSAATRRPISTRSVNTMQPPCMS